MADRARYAANSDGRTERRRERRAAESSEQRETRLARRRVADRAMPLVASEGDSSYNYGSTHIQLCLLSKCVFLILYIHSIILLYMYITKYGCVFLKLDESTYVAIDLIPILFWVRSRSPIMLSIH